MCEKTLICDNVIRQNARWIKVSGKRQKYVLTEFPFYFEADDVFHNIRFIQTVSEIDDKTERTVIQINHGLMNIAAT